MSTGQPVRLLDEFRQRRRDLLRAAGPGILATLAAFAVAFYFVEPSPPDQLVIACGPAGGRYYATAAAYAEMFERSGITLELRETAGSLENFQLLLQDETVSLAIVQGGTAPPEARSAETIQALASLYFEPLWVFHRSELPIADIADLKGHRIAVGRTGSGTHSLALQLLEANGVRDGTDGTRLLQQDVQQAVPALNDGRIDVAMFVLGPEAEVLKQLLLDPEIVLLDFGRQRAYERRFPFLKGVDLEPGVLDFEQNLPRTRVRLIAPAANLVASDTLHEAFIPLLLEAVLDQHHDGGLLADHGQLPSLEYVSFPVNSTARRYLTHGPSFFQRHLSFWIASLIDRTKNLILPLVTLLIPLFRIAPPVYRWRTRSRIYRWYGVLRQIDQQLREGSPERAAAHAATLNAMSHELDTVQVPLSYMEEFYNLRLHINLVQGELESMRHQQVADSAQPVAVPEKGSSKEPTPDE